MVTINTFCGARVEPRASHILHKCFTTELYFQLWKNTFWREENTFQPDYNILRLLIKDASSK
jgi:hypothetical protein